MSLVRRKGNSHSLRSDPFSLTASLAHQGLSEVLGHKAGPQPFPTKARPEWGGGGHREKATLNPTLLHPGLVKGLSTSNPAPCGTGGGNRSILQ